MKAYVLLSGGIDSTTCLYLANDEFEGKVVGVSIDYGQRHRKEMEYAAISCRHLGLEHEVIDLSGIIPTTMLTDRGATVPDVPYSSLPGISPTYVPFRNGLMLSALASRMAGAYKDAGAEGEWGLYFGAHAEDAHNWAYPDCTPEFTGAMAALLYVGTYHTIRLYTPLQWFHKAQIINLGEQYNVEWEHTWSCYKGDIEHCGTCPTCRARREGFNRAGVVDPTPYQA